MIGRGRSRNFTKCAFGNGRDKSAGWLTGVVAENNQSGWDEKEGASSDDNGHCHCGIVFGFNGVLKFDNHCY